MRRLATVDDLAEVYRIYQDESVIPHLGHDAMPLDAFRPVFADLIAAKSFYIFEVAGAAAGFYRVTRVPGRAFHVAHLGPIAIAPESQGQGIGRAMLTDALAHLEAEGVLRVELLSETDNNRGRNFYRSVGFHEEGIQRKAYKRARDPNYVDEVMLVRFIGALAK